MNFLQTRPAVTTGRPLLVVTVLVGMALGLYGGLLRIGVPLPAADRLTDIHGPLMICGVFGTLIALERAVAIGSRPAFLAPSLLSLGGISLVAGMPEAVTESSFLAGASSFVASTGWIFQQQRAVFTAMLLAGTLALLGGIIAWVVTDDVRGAAGAWLLFLVATIAGERLELSRAIVRSRLSVPGFLLAICLLGAGAALGLQQAIGAPLFGVGLIALTIWLAINDVATSTVRMRGQARYMAIAMLSGYAWLPVAGLQLIFAPEAAFGYDLALHAVLIGFVLSMVFGHALIIFPAVSRIGLRYHPALYLPLAVLHFSVTLRAFGDVTETAMLRTLSGPLTASALIAFAMILLVARRRR